MTEQSLEDRQMDLEASSGIPEFTLDLLLMIVRTAIRNECRGRR
jgi:hypothetical protein